MAADTNAICGPLPPRYGRALCGDNAGIRFVSGCRRGWLSGAGRRRVNVWPLTRVLAYITLERMGQVALAHQQNEAFAAQDLFLPLIEALSVYTQERTREARKEAEEIADRIEADSTIKRLHARANFASLLQATEIYINDGGEFDISEQMADIDRVREVLSKTFKDVAKNFTSLARFFGQNNREASAFVRDLAKRALADGEKWESEHRAVWNHLRIMRDRQREKTRESKIERGKLAYQSALNDVFGYAKVIGYSANLEEEIPIYTLTVQIAPKLHSNAREVVEREMRAHRIIRKAQPDIAGMFSIHYESLGSAP